MEEMKNVSSKETAENQQTRKPYTPPAAEIILLEPQEALAAWDFKYHGDSAADRWALNGWKYPLGDDIASAGIQGTITPTLEDGTTNWKLQ